jgi:hypothetical protein
MNLSARKLVAVRERDGRAADADERPSYVRDALSPERRVGWRDGRPLVSHPEGADDELTLGDDPSSAYSHYKRGDDLLMPDAGAFLQELADADEVSSVSDMADEIKTSQSVVSRAMGLHGVEPPSNGDGETEGDNDEREAIRLPSGESLPLAILCDPPWRDKLVLADLLGTCGLSVGEAARWLTEHVTDGGRVTESDVRGAARDANLLDGPSDDGRRQSPVPRDETTQTAGDAYASSPW